MTKTQSCPDSLDREILDCLLAFVAGRISDIEFWVHAQNLKMRAAKIHAESILDAHEKQSLSEDMIVLTDKMMDRIESEHTYDWEQRLLNVEKRVKNESELDENEIEKTIGVIHLLITQYREDCWRI